MDNPRRPLLSILQRDFYGKKEVKEYLRKLILAAGVPFFYNENSDSRKGIGGGDIECEQKNRYSELLSGVVF